nr:phosphatidylcholine:ceramide cholinephosphotransferase 1-like [Dermatophagoides farinae]
MNYSTNTSTATTTPRLRTLQSSTSTSSSSSSPSGSLLSTNRHHQYHHHHNNNNNKHINSNVSINNNNTNNINNNNNTLANNHNHQLKSNNFIAIAQQSFISPPNHNLNHPIIEQTIMMMSSNDGTVSGGITTSGGGGGGVGVSGGKSVSSKMSDKQAQIGEIEPLLSSTSSSTTISPMHETYNANKTTVIIHDNNNKDHHRQNDGQSSSVHLTMDSSSSSSPHHRNHNGLIHHSSNSSHNPEGDSLHSSIEEESSSLLMSSSDHYLHPNQNYMVIRTQSLKNIILLNLLSLVFVSLNMILNLLVISVIHERIPMQEPHLPDIAFDVLPDHRHFLDIAEYVIVIQSFCIGVLLFFHKHRSTILRRICIIMGIIYFFRALCLASTQLPLASKNYYCSPQLKNSSQYENITSLQFIEIIVSRVFYMSLGMGLSINGHHTFCGDYIFSGHTVILVLTYLIQQEYLLPSRRRTLSWRCVDIIQIIMTLTSILCILIARGHYFIDIIIAYFVTTRIFWIYHTLCYFSAINLKSSSNHLNRVWWWPIFVYLENIRVIPNHHSQSLPNHYNHSKHHHHMKNDDHHRVNQVQRIFEWPLPWPKRFARRKHHRSHQFSA